MIDRRHRLRGNGPRLVPGSTPLEIGSREGQYMSTTANVAREMVRRGYSEQEIEKPVGVRGYKTVWK